MREHPRKRRTREHIIADLSVNHVERMVLRCGHTVEHFWYDYGFDLQLFTYDNNGEYENGNVRLQVKATDRLRRTAHGQSIAWPVESAHLDHWLKEPMPVILVVYDAMGDRAYWLYIQRYFEERRGSNKDGRATVSVRLPVENVLNEDAVRQFARYRNNILSQARGVIRHHD